MIPIAHGRIGTLGNVVHGTGNFTSTWNGAQNRYEITIEDVFYSVNTHSTFVTPICLNPQVVRTTSFLGSITVDYTNSGQCQFAFITYASPS